MDHGRRCAPPRIPDSASASGWSWPTGASRGTEWLICRRLATTTWRGGPSFMRASLTPYWKKRDFKVTAEPRGEVVATGKRLSFVIQKHAATRLHYDFRLELGRTVKSWAVPKGPSLDPTVKRMAVHVEDHPLSYASFEGTIPKGQYGAGTVIVWDRGTWAPVGDPREGYRKGKLKFDLFGEKLHGRWNLVRIKSRENERQEPWLLIKED